MWVVGCGLPTAAAKCCESSSRDVYTSVLLPSVRKGDRTESLGAVAFWLRTNETKVFRLLSRGWPILGVMWTGRRRARMGWQASNERGFSPASSLESPPARPPCSQSTMPGMLVLLSFLASLLLSCLCFPSVWASITGGDEFLDAHEAGLAVVASRKSAAVLVACPIPFTA